MCYAMLKIEMLPSLKCVPAPYVACCTVFTQTSQPVLGIGFCHGGISITGVGDSAFHTMALTVQQLQ